MTAKEKYWKKNLLQAEVVRHGRIFHVFHNLRDKEAKVLETGVRKTIGRRDFRKWIKSLGGKCIKPLKTGEYININTGQREKLFGID